MMPHFKDIVHSYINNIKKKHKNYLKVQRNTVLVTKKIKREL